MKKETLAALNVAGVLEDRHRGTHFTKGRECLLVVVVQNVLGMFFAIGLDRGIEPHLLHGLEASGATALHLIDDIQPDAVGVREEPGGLLDLLAEIVEVGGVKAQLLKASFGRLDGPAVVGAGREMWCHSGWAWAAWLLMPEEM